MAFLRSGSSLDLPWLIRSRGLLMRPPQSSDYIPWAELRARSREHLVPWEPSWGRDELSRAAFRRRLKIYQQDMRDDMGYAFLIWSDDETTLYGGLTLSNVRRGVAQTCTLGYWVGVNHARQGIMTRAVSAIIPYAAHELRLHRIEAACLPHNQGSQAVLQRCGFRHEGLAYSYLKINGLWRDHLLFGRILDDTGGGPL